LYGFSDPEKYIYKAPKGISAQIVTQISHLKSEKPWMLKQRLQAYQTFLDKPMPTWGSNLSDIDFDNIYYYLKPTQNQQKKWSDLPEEIKNTYQKLGIPQAEAESLAGVKAQYDSEVIYGSIKKKLSD